jgi:hypothetical protein
MWARFALVALLAVGGPARGGVPADPEQTRLERVSTQVKDLEAKARVVLRREVEPMEPDIEQALEDLAERHQAAWDAWEAYAAASKAQQPDRRMAFEAAVDALESAYNEALRYPLERPLPAPPPSAPGPAGPVPVIRPPLPAG